MKGPLSGRAPGGVPAGLSCFPPAPTSGSLALPAGGPEGKLVPKRAGLCTKARLHRTSECKGGHAGSHAAPSPTLSSEGRAPAPPVGQASPFANSAHLTCRVTTERSHLAEKENANTAPSLLRGPSRLPTADPHPAGTAGLLHPSRRHWTRKTRVGIASTVREFPRKPRRP